MTKREAAIIMAYTGQVMLTGEDFGIFHKYVEHILERPVYTHEFASESVMDEIKEKSKNDFIDICKNAVDTNGEDPLVCALEEIKQLNTDLAIRCGNDSVRSYDVNKTFLIRELIETAMGRETESERSEREKYLSTERVEEVKVIPHED